MKNTIVENAYAKVNLYLAVGRLRADGYHEIVTYMRRISLYDTLSLTCIPSDRPMVRLSTEGDPTPQGADNLIVRAADLFFAHTGLSCTVEIHLVKRIPSMAGLGGGSSDAAATLCGLNRWFGAPLSKAELSALSATLGSDVPFFVTENAAICYGRGEKLISVSVHDASYIVVVKGAESSSTAEAYRALDASGQTREDIFPVSENPAEWPHRNDFEQPISLLCPSVAANLGRLRDLGAAVAMMSGSGSAVFGIFPSEDSARSAADALGDAAYFCRMLPD